MSGYGGLYTDKASILTFAQSLKSDLVLADITDAMLAATTEMINERTDTYWNVFAGNLYVDGRGEDFIFSPIVPIVTLTELGIIDTDTTEEKLIVSGITRQVWMNEETGQISRVDLFSESHIERDPDPGANFPRGVKNIRIKGTFGRTTNANTLAMIQTLMIIQMLKYKYPTDFQTDIIREKIGQYEYVIGDQQYAKDPKNAKKTLEGYIEYLFDCLPKDDKLCVLAI